MFKELVERINDNLYRNCAREVYNIILSELNKPISFSKPPLQFKIYESYWTIIKNCYKPIEDIDSYHNKEDHEPEDSDLYFCFVPNNQHNASFGSGVISLILPVEEMEIINGKLSVRSQRELVNKYKSYIFEEIYHMIDDYFYLNKGEGNWKDSDEAYANSPVETNAKFQNVIMELIDNYGDSLNKQNYVDLAIKTFERMHPKEFPLLTPENRKKFLKRVYDQMEF